MNRRFGIATVVFAVALLGCNGTESVPNNGNSDSLGGSTGRGSGGTVANGGTGGSSKKPGEATGGKSAASSDRSTTRASAGGASAAKGGSEATGGKRSTGGAEHAGGSRARSTTSADGTVPAGGTTTVDGTTTAGGTAPTGGVSSTAKSSKTGGASSVGGSTAAGTTAAGGSPASGGTSASSDSAYVPCAASPCKVLPLGDSITHGLQSSDGGGYRSQLFKLVVAAKQTLTFLGSQSAGPANVSGETFPKNHEGYDGYTIESGFSTYGTAGISSRIPSPAFSTIPDIVLLHIGTNDITSTGSASATAATRLDGLLGKIVAAAPKALIVVAQITPVNWTSADLDTYNSKIPGLVQARASQGQHIISVDMSKMPKSSLATDV